MSKFYTAIVTNESEGTNFKVLIKADSIAQARSGAASHLIDVDRASDQEIFEAGKHGLFVLNLSDLPTDGVHPDQQPLINDTSDVDNTGGDQPFGGHFGKLAGDEPIDCGAAAPQVLIGATKSGSAPNWLQDAVSQRTGD